MNHFQTLQTRSLSSACRDPHSLSAIFIWIPQDAWHWEYFDEYSLHNYPPILNIQVLRGPCLSLAH